MTPGFAALLGVVALALGAAAAAGAAYLVAIAVAGAVRSLRSASRPMPGSVPGAAEGSRFAVIIPAHNEQALLPQALQSLRAQAYPADRFEVVVVADNCSDATANVARDHGVICLERDDPRHRGKAHALNYALARLPLDDFDAVVFMDADQIAAPDLLRAFDKHLSQGAEAIQAACVAAPVRGPVGYLLAVEGVVENRLFYAARARLGLTCMLRGTGMCLRRGLAARYRWPENALAEDLELSLTLLAEGVHVLFAPEAVVTTAEPETLRQAWVQRSRWSRGAMVGAVRAAARLLWRGLLTGRIRLAEGALSAMVTSKSALTAIALVALGLSLVAGNAPAQVVAVAALVLLAAYMGVGVALTRPGRREAAYLALAPALLGWRVVCHLWAAVQGPREWARTGR